MVETSRALHLGSHFGLLKEKRLTQMVADPCLEAFVFALYGYGYVDIGGNNVPFLYHVQYWDGGTGEVGEGV